MPAAYARRARGEQLVGSGDERAVGGAGQEAAGRGSAHSCVPELREARPARQREDVDRRLHGLHDGADLVEVGQPGRVQAVGAGIPVGDEARDRVVEVVDVADVVLGAAGEHHRLGQGVRGLGRLGDTLRRQLDVVDTAGRGVVVLDRAARRARLGEAPHRLRHTARLVRVAALAVDVQRDRRRRREGADMRHELVAADTLVEPAERPREPGARRRERLEAGGLEQPSGADVPRVRQREELLARVQLTEARPALGDRHARTLERRK